MPFFNFKRARKSFTYAFRGLKTVWKEEQNFRFQVAVAVLVLSAAYLLQVKKTDFIILFLLVGLVLILELINSSFERLIDILKPRIHEYSKEIKNISSAVVLVSAILSAIAGIIIFFPYIFK